LDFEFTECGLDSPNINAQARRCLIQLSNKFATLTPLYSALLPRHPTSLNYFSPVVRMRQSLELFANLRPCRSIPHKSSKENIDMLIVRENTEGLYSGIERVEDDGNTPSPNESSPAKARKESFAKRSRLPNKQAQIRSRYSQSQRASPNLRTISRSGV
jgi:isocitrate/isopropylmalate dehydrogenase